MRFVFLQECESTGKKKEKSKTTLGEMQSNANNKLQRMKRPIEVLSDKVNRCAIAMTLQDQDAKCVDDQERCAGRVVPRCCEVEGKIK